MSKVLFFVIAFFPVLTAPCMAIITAATPERITSHPAEDYAPGVSADGKLLVFVSNRGGAPNIWIRTIDGPEIQSPVRITGSVAGDKNPRFSPDGKYVVYVSTGSDTEGDLYIVKTPGLGDVAEYKPLPKRITDISTADGEPVFTADGKSIIFTSRDKNSTAENLWELNLATQARKQLTENGGSSAAISADGTKLVYVVTRRSGNGALFTMDIETGRKKMLTTGKWADSSPAFMGNSKIVFTRYQDDTNKDGEVTVDDNPSLYAIDLARRDMPPVPLTSQDSYDLFPVFNKGFIYYSSKRGASVDVLRIPEGGVVRALGSLEKDMARAKAFERFYVGKPAMPILAWRVAWAVNADSNNKSALAECLFSEARLIEKSGGHKMALPGFEKLVKLYPDERLWHGLALIEIALIDGKLNEVQPLKTTRELEKIAVEYGDVRQVVARARIEAGTLNARAGKLSLALKLFRGVVAEFADLKPLAAEAGYKRNGVYLFSGDNEKLTDVYLDVIKNFQDEKEWVEKSINGVLSLAEVKGDTKSSIAALNALIEKYKNIPALAGAAMNRIAEIYYENNELMRAREVYGLTVSRFPNETDVKHRAMFRIAEILAEEERYEQSLLMYKNIASETASEKELYKKSREGFINKALDKGTRELSQGDVRLALKTFLSVIDFDPNVTEAHRGVIRCRVALKETEKAVAHYKKLVANSTDNDTYLYSLGLALTYREPSGLASALERIKSAIAIDRSNPWYHQTLGWIYEQKEIKGEKGPNAELALQEYGYALGLTDPQKFPQRVADLNLNLGNINYLLQNNADALNYYRARAFYSGAKLKTPAVEALYQKRWGEVEYRLGSDGDALLHFKEALKFAPSKDIAFRIELLERMGLANQSAGNWSKAVKNFSESLKLRRSIGAVENETVILRNIANNLYFLSRDNGKARDPEKLREALKFYHEGEAALKDYREKKKSKSSALLSIEIKTGEGGVKGASEGFGEAGERRLIFHHIGKIYGDLGDYGKAVEYFEKKLKLSPSGLSLLGNTAVIAEKAVILNQLGFYLTKLGQVGKALERFVESLKLCMQLENATGLIVNTDNIARLLLGAFDDSLSVSKSKIEKLGVQALKLAAKDSAVDSKALSDARLHLGQLFYRLFVNGLKTLDEGDVKDRVSNFAKVAGYGVSAKALYMAADNLASITNLALLEYAEGDTKQALALLNRAKKIADTNRDYNVLWKTRFLKFTMNPSRFKSELGKIAKVLEQVPVEQVLGDDSQMELAMIRTLYNELAKQAQDDVEALSWLERGRQIVLKRTLFGMPSVWEDVDTGEFDVDSVAVSLGEDETAVALWNTGDEFKAFVILPDGFVVQKVNGYEGFINFINEKIPQNAKIFFVTNKPFSDPLTLKLSEKYSVTSVPSFALIPAFKEKRSVNDFRLLAFSEEMKMQDDASELFANVKFALGDIAKEAIENEAIKFAGVLMFATAPDISKNLAGVRFSINSPGTPPMWLDMKSIIAAGAEGSLIVTPPFRARNGRDWESGLQVMALMAGFPSWVITPADKKEREPFLNDLVLALHGAGSAKWPVPIMNSAKSGARLAGAFGFSLEEKADRAKEIYTDKVKAGVAAFKAGDFTSSAGYLEDALIYTRSAHVKKYEALLLDRLAEVEFRLGRFASALKRQKALNKIYRKSDDKIKLANSLLLTGVMHSRTGKHESALKNMHMALEIFRKEKALDKVADALSKLGIAEESFTRYGRALSAYSAALDARMKTGAKLRGARELMRMGRIYHLRMNKYGEARKVYKEALEIFKAENSEAMTNRALIDLGAVEEDAGNLSEAEQIFRKVLSKARADENRSTEALVMFHLANISWFRGDYEDAIQNARNSARLADVAENTKLKIMAMNTAGLVYITLNDYAKALYNLEKSFALARSASARLDEASALNNIGLAYRRMGEPEKSVGYFKQALGIDKEIKSDWGRAYDLRNLSISYLILGDLDAAKKTAVNAVDISLKIGDRVNGAKSKLQLAEVYLVRGKTEKAERLYRETIDMADKNFLREVAWRARRGLGRLSVTAGKKELAVSLYKDAVDIVEKMRGSIKADELKKGFLDDKQELYEELILLLLDKGETRMALEYTERARARSFIDILGKSSVKLKSKLAQNAYDKIQKLKERLDELSAGPDAPERISVAKKLQEAMDKLRRENPEVVSFVAVEPVSADEITNVIDNDVLLLEYLVTEKELVIFTISTGSIEVKRLPVTRKEVKKLVFDLRKRIQDSAPLGDASRRLAQILIEPVRGKLDAFEVVGIAPHGSLHYLSFSALDMGDGYLIDSKPLFYTPSLTMFAKMVARKSKVMKPEEHSALAVGNPDLGINNTDLPLSEIEAVSLRRVFHDVKIFIRATATEGAVTKNAPYYDVVHIASHGQFDPLNPLKSALRLAPDMGHDGFLSAGEVFSMDLSANLVVLSACQTGVGKVSRGDEVVGLNRAFLYSGARSILSTLWRVDDMASAILVKHFYRNLADNGKAQALRMAQLAVKRNYPHPSFWAGFTLVGDYR
ncbi:hypothetical protein MNBD_NITROSPINAE01-560 [hydrothermal vent metagenome]|uniref:CHAT domain-containing protein n=1 Tax=hydrothermal vent metagenome TaxID=652676 RepID=A0A3B1B9D9_9ZZZZ